MSARQVRLLHLCRAKLRKEAAQRDPRLDVVVGHSNLLDTLISNFADQYHGRRTRYVEATSQENNHRGITNDMSSDSKDSLPDDLGLAEDEVVLDGGNAQEGGVIISKRSTYNDKISFRETQNCTSLDEQGNDDAYKVEPKPGDNVEQFFSLRVSYPDNCAQWISDNTILE
jgi:hypothetical protein